MFSRLSFLPHDPRAPLVESEIFCTTARLVRGTAALAVQAHLAPSVVAYDDAIHASPQRLNRIRGGQQTLNNTTSIVVYGMLFLTRPQAFACMPHACRRTHAVATALHKSGQQHAGSRQVHQSREATARLIWRWGRALTNSGSRVTERSHPTNAQVRLASTFFSKARASELPLSGALTPASAARPTRLGSESPSGSSNLRRAEAAVPFPLLMRSAVWVHHHTRVVASCHVWPAHARVCS